MRLSSTRPRRGLALLGVAALALSTAACAQSERTDDGGGGGEGEEASGGTFVFAASADPVMLDPAFASDGETFRVARNMFEGLVGTEPGTADPAPLLAKSWTQSDDGLSYTFQLEEGVTFHDGTDFNAEAVCANFERWYNWTGILQSQNLTYYYQAIFKGFAESETPELQGGIYGGCEPVSETEVTVSLTQPFAAFIQTLSLPAFSMQSPSAMEEFDANSIEGTEDDPRFSAYATENPTGTGPFKFGSWERGQAVTLLRYDEYWGEVAKIDEAIIRTISDPNARLQALNNGDIDAYDNVAPGDIEGLEADGFTVESRPPFTILYLGMNQAVPELADIRVRQAIAHAIDKEAVISQSLPEDTEAAIEFIPPTVAGWTDEVTQYEYDPEKAKALLAEAGVPDLTLQFNYPTDVSRPYMPTPEATYTAISAQLEAVGITIQPVADPWSPNYLDKIQGTEDHGIHLLGWTGDYNDTDNFLGVFFGGPANEWGFENPELFTALTEARQLPTRDEQIPLYEEINKTIMDFLPGIPIAHPSPSLAFAPGVDGYTPSPVNDEVWNQVTVTRD
ncbi:MAG TPA: ABC transporter substrate-binding protein [Actinomycetales bacterium]|nr:ABC transporter substrate-binding protein [Actinomycetales bacterium]